MAVNIVSANPPIKPPVMAICSSFIYINMLLTNLIRTKSQRFLLLIKIMLGDQIMICETCGKEFNEDWRKDRQSRKTPCRFCSRTCSNTKIHSDETKAKIKKTMTKYELRYCKCGKQLNHKNKSGICIDCQPPAKTRYEHVKEHRKNRKALLVNHLGGKCIKCGYDDCIEALEFHHLDPTQKDFTISDSNKTRTLEQVIAEIEKCVLLCCRCHVEVHYNLRQGIDILKSLDQTRVERATHSVQGNCSTN